MRSSIELERKLLLAIDPGPVSSGVVLYGASSHQLLHSKDTDNHEILLALRKGGILLDNGDVAIPTMFAVEDIVGMGMAVGKSTFDTCKWIGRFIEAYENSTGDKKANLVSRRDVKVVLAGGNTYECPNTGARKTVSDAYIKLLLKDMFEPSGGGKNPVVGTKGLPGPLYGLKGHSWSALAVAMTYLEIQTKG